MKYANEPHNKNNKVPLVKHEIAIQGFPRLSNND